MRTNGAFRRPGRADRFREWWYRQKPSARVNKLLYLAVAVGVVAFVNVANRDTTTPASGLPARPTVTSTAPPTTEVQTTLPATTTTTPPTSLAVTTTVARKPVVTTRPTTTRPTTATTRPPPAPPAADPGAIFTPAPATVLPPITAPSMTTVPPLTTTVPANTGAIPSSSTTTSRP